MINLKNLFYIEIPYDNTMMWIYTTIIFTLIFLVIYNLLKNFIKLNEYCEKKGIDAVDAFFGGYKGDKQLSLLVFKCWFNIFAYALVVFIWV